jgi:5-deoxy-glucuronate isomerase
MERLIKAQAERGSQQIVRPGVLRFLDFARLNLVKGQKHSRKTQGREYVLDIFSGTVTVTVETADGQRQVFPNVGARGDVFSGPPVMVYLPAQSSYEITAESEMFDAGIFSAPSTATASAVLLEGAAVVAKQVGRDNWQRTVYSALTDDVPAQRLLAGETPNPPGNWSSYPPHKHDRLSPPQEAILEEVYFFRTKPAQGFGLMWTCTAPGDPDGFSTALVVEDGDTVLLPKGYHPVVAAPGCQLHYAWVLAGEERRYGAWADDPRHAWVKNAVAISKG